MTTTRDPYTEELAAFIRDQAEGQEFGWYDLARAVRAWFDVQVPDAERKVTDAVEALRNEAYREDCHVAVDAYDAARAELARARTKAAQAPTPENP